MKKKLIRQLRFESAGGDHIQATLSTEAPVKRGNLEGGYFEVLKHERGSIDLSRFPLPVLEGHDQSRTNIAIAENPKIADGKLTASVRFGSSTRAQELKADVEAGIVRNLSLGYRWVDFSEETRGGEDYVVVRKFIPLELSIVSVPADVNSGFNRKLEMPDETTGTEMTSPEKKPATAKQLRSLAEQYGIQEADAQIVDLMDRGLTADQADRELFKTAKQNLWADRIDSECSRSDTSIAFGDRPNIQMAFSDALVQRAGVHLEKPHPAAQDFNRLPLPEMARSILQTHGIRDSALRPDQVIQRAMGTDDFQNLLLGVSNKVLQNAYTQQQPTFEAWTGRKIAPFFKDVNIVNLSEMPALEAVGELSEYTYGGVSDTKETIGLAKFGKIFAISFEAMAGDDIGAFDGLVAAFGAQAQRKESDLVYAALASNPVLSDGTSFFDTSRGNTVAAGAALDIASLSAARSAMRRFTGLDGKTYIDAVPTTLLVPVALETTAQQLVASITPAKTADVTPRWVSDLQVIADPRLDDISTTAWYLFASPEQIEGFSRVYLDNNPVTIEQQTSFNRDALEIKCRLVAGIGAIDWRAAYLNPGA